MCLLSKEKSILSRETNQHAFFFFFQNYAPFLTWGKKLTFVNISVITEDVYFKLGICVHYTKSNSYYQDRQFKMHF